MTAIRLARIASAIALLLLPAVRGGAAPGYTLRVVALEGDPAPGTATVFGVPADVAIDAAGDVAFASPLASGVPLDGGVWVDAGGGPALRIRTGDAAPGTGGGSYLALGGFVNLDASGRVATAAFVSGGTAGSGLFADAGGGDTALAVSGDPAPAGVGGTLDLGLSDIGIFGFSPSGDLAFRSGVTGGSAAGGVFAASGGVVSTVALLGGAAPGTGGGTYADFADGSPSANDAGVVAFSGGVSGGSTAHGVFRDGGGGVALVAAAGDAAPDTGGATFLDFLYPAVSPAGDVAFLANTGGGSAAGGLFRADAGGIAAVVVDGAAAPDTGGGHFVSIASIPVFAGEAVVMSGAVDGGTVDGGVFVRPEGGSLFPVALAGESVAGVAGATLASFSFVDANAMGEVAFVALLDDQRTGVFVASPVAPPVPALPIPARLLLGFGLGSMALSMLRARASAKRAGA